MQQIIIANKSQHPFYYFDEKTIQVLKKILQASSTLWSAVQEVSSLVEVTLLLTNQRAISCKNLYKLTTLNPSHPVCFFILRPTNLIVFKLLSNLEIIFATISSRLTRLSVCVFNCCGLRLGLKLTSSYNAAAFFKLSHHHPRIISSLKLGGYII